MKAYSFSAKGRRENNEDYILNRQLSPDCSLFLVADGMGGYLYGEIASSLACEVIAEYLVANYGKSGLKQMLSHSLIVANKKIYEKRQEIAAKMGTTIAGTVIEGSTAYLFWCGDVRIYQFRNNEIIFQSEDHSLINEMKKQVNVSASEIERYGHIVTRALTGITMEEDQDIIELSLMLGDVLIICTDGFWQNINVSSVSNLTEEEIQDQLDTHKEDMDDNFSILKLNF